MDLLKTLKKAFSQQSFYFVTSNAKMKRHLTKTKKCSIDCWDLTVCGGAYKGHTEAFIRVRNSSQGLVTVVPCQPTRLFLWQDRSSFIEPTCPCRGAARRMLCTRGGLCVARIRQTLTWSCCCVVVRRRCGVATAFPSWFFSQSSPSGVSWCCRWCGFYPAFTWQVSSSPLMKHR